MNYSTTITEERIEAQETKDRYVASECLKWLLRKGTDLKIVPTDTTDYVDLNCSIINTKDILIPFNVEIKERNKSQEQLAKYPNAELKVAKYNRMKEATPEGTRLLYMVLLNNKTCLVFDMDNLDWDKVETKNWRIKRTQYSDNSDWVVVPTYFIPYDLAIGKCDCSNFYNEWEMTIA